MRVIEDHKVNQANDRLKITVTDEPGPGGANHAYVVTLTDWTQDPDAAKRDKGVWYIDFQKGPINEAGVNGLTQEVLLAIVIDRLRAFQAGPFSCRENALALTKLEEAQHWLLARTRGRTLRGVEGTNAA